MVIPLKRNKLVGKFNVGYLMEFMHNITTRDGISIFRQIGEFSQWKM